MKIPLRRILVILSALVLLGMFIHSAWRVLPPQVVHIETGPLGGSFHENALKYLGYLERVGLKTDIHPDPQSLHIVQRLNGEDGGHVDIGFTAQWVDPTAFPNVFSAGAIELQPLFLFLRKDLGAIASPAGLLGKRVVMPPEFSASAKAARDVMALYGVTAQNTHFSYMLIADASAALQKGQFDAGFFMLAPANAMIDQLGRHDDLTLYSFNDVEAIARKLSYLKPCLLPHGAFELRLGRPEVDVRMVGATVNVIVNRDIHPAVLYALLNAMKDVHSGQTLVSSRGDYPSFANTDLPLHPLVGEWAKNGTPWIYKMFSPLLASLIQEYWLPVLAVVAVVSVYDTLNKLYNMIHLLTISAALEILTHLRASVSGGRRPGPLHRALFRLAEGVVMRDKRDKKARELLDQLRSELKP